MKIGSFSPDNFVRISDSEIERNLRTIGMEPLASIQQAKKKCKGDAAYKDEHLRYFKAFDLSWPPLVVGRWPSLSQRQRAEK